MVATPRIQTMDSDRQKKTAKIIARLLSTLSWIIAIVAAIVLIVLLMTPMLLPIWAWALALVFTVVAGGLLFVLAERYERRYLEKAGYGIKTLENVGAQIDGNVAILTLRDRKVVADIIKTTELQPSGYTQHLTGVTYTRISAEHKGKIPCVIQASLHGKKRTSFLDKDVYLAWIREHPRSQFQLMPEKVYLNGSEVASTLPEESIPRVAERAERILDDPNMTTLKGFITIEPGRVWWLRRKDLLPHELLESAVNVLVDVAQRTEKEYGLLSNN